MLMRKISRFLGMVGASGMFLINRAKVMAVDPFDGCNPAGSDNPQINTALGCIPVKIEDFVTWLLPYLFGIVGGISFLLMVYGFILLSTSKGDPKVVQGARETISSAITGLLVSIFALFLLRLIAVDILQIPGIN